MGLFDYFAEGGLGVEVVEDIAEGAGKYRFDFLDFVAAELEVLEGFDDGEAGADIGFVEEFGVGFTGGGSEV